ncbi:bacterioferritin-associated ferredoxin [Undibacterium arcticum]|uniref:Bacterioferritin-associated ferredoxin n=1 Tax=Undibacterium arcticum TaxID=1762892 RepID=A0ABV7F0U4_9BURK
MIVCICNNVSDREIRQAVDLGVSSMSELSNDLGVATCCGQCADCAKQVLQDHIQAQRSVQRAAQQDVREVSFRRTPLAA